MAKRSRLFLGTSVLLALAGTVASAQAATNPFDAWGAMFEQSFRQATRVHPPKYRVHKPVLVKAAPDETPVAPPPGPAAILAPDVPDAVLPLPQARPAELPDPAMPPLPLARPPAAQAEAADVVPALPKPPGKAPTKLAALTPPTEGIEAKPSSAFANLAALGVKSVPIAPIEEGKCTVLDPVSVASLESGAVPLVGKTILNDRMAETFAKWVHEDVVPAAHDILAGELTGIGIIGSYSCRSRYDLLGGGKMSEHGFANAIDVAGFRVDKRWIVVGGDKHNAADDARFLDTVRHAACRRFTTVLGPGQPLHDTHFHLDLERRGKSGRYTICE
jgi:hypothetical protein